MTATTQSGAQNSDADIKQELKENANKIADSAKKQAEGQARSTRDQAVKAAQSTSSAIETAAQDLREDADTPDWVAGMFGSVAKQISQFAQQADAKEPQDMLRTVQDFGRSNPTAFLAGAAAVGFAAGRVMRAGAEQHDAIGAVSPGSSAEHSRSNDAETQNRSSHTPQGGF
ncbi:MAG: hypothetical protein AAF291_00500 [Pseudomonadota bacterium]